MTNKRSSWELQKTIPITIFLAIIINILSTVWWAAKLDSRLGMAETWIKTNYEISTQLDRFAMKSSVMNKRMSTIEEEYDKINTTTNGRAVTVKLLEREIKILKDQIEKENESG